MSKYDGKPIPYPRGHVSNVFSRMNWHNEYRYLYGPAVDNRDPFEVWNAEKARERDQFAAENARRREAELKAWQEAKERRDWEMSPEGQRERDRAWWREHGGRDRTK
jgi:hypothetical protein